MATEVDICNLALALLGDSATVSSIDPPEGSPQAGHCARFYPMARDSFLEMHAWGFASKRATLALSTVTSAQWAYVYFAPNGMLNVLGVFDPAAPDDIMTGIPLSDAATGTLPVGSGVFTPQPYVLESNDNGDQLIYTNQQDAVLHYTGKIVNAAKFSPLFVDALAWLLASKLAGPIIKGDAGVKAAQAAYNAFLAAKGMAITSDANQRRLTSQNNVSAPWITGR